MAIQMRRGQKADFDSSKMLPGEWAVAIDSDTNNQIVWMCFSPGIAKRMGTYEDFEVQIQEIADSIGDEYKKEFNAILVQVKELEKNTEQNKDAIIIIRDDVVNTYLPQMQACVKEAHESEKTAAESAILSQSYAVGDTQSRKGESTDNSKYYCEQSLASSKTAQSYAEAAERAGDEAVQKINDAIGVNLPVFRIDLLSGHLQYEGGRFDFYVPPATGHLMWEVSV